VLVPTNVSALSLHGRLLRALKRNEQAILSFNRALSLRRDDADDLVGRGNAHYELKSYPAALADYERALTLRPDAPQLHNNRGNALCELCRLTEALESFDRTLALDPDYAEAHNHRGNVLLKLNDMHGALSAYDRALALKPDFTDALVNRGNALDYLGRTDEALASFDRAIAADPQLAEAQWNKALVCLALGDFARGFAGYEWRWRRRNAEGVRDFTQPLWRGEDLTGKTILLHAEQGFGDTIQFVRYMPMVAAKAARVILELPDSLRPLTGAMEAAAAFTRRGDPLPVFDVHCPLMSLPLAFGTTLETVPATAPYLRAPAERVERLRPRLPAESRPRIGLVWSGKPTHKNDHNRTIPLAALAPVLDLDNLAFVSLQCEYRDSDVPELERRSNLMRLEDALTDFADTAAAISELDLVIAVDTAVAHLAGALGKPVWILLSHVHDWRWLRSRNTSPWYPTARLFRQSAPGDWTEAIARVAEELADFQPAAR
jgi:tetratricopeptide (TPR) repeat protein